MATQRQLDLIAEQNALAVATTRSRVLAAVQAIWMNSPNYRDADIERLLKRIIPLVEAGTVQVAQLTSTYLAQEATLMRGVPYAPAKIDRPALKEIRGVPMAEVYRRPAATLYTALSEGVRFLDAKGMALNRLVSLVGTDLQLAKTTQAKSSLKKSGAKYFRRRLSGTENCAICVVAAHQRYKTGELMPIHPGCDCGVSELPGDKDPGQTIDQSSLDLMYAQIDQHLPSKPDGEKLVSYKNGRTRNADLTELMVVQQHGELGPVLTWRGQSFTGPSDLP